MLRRFDLGRAALAVGAALLLISLFLDWYDTGLTGWEVFETLDLVLAALALGGIAIALRPDLAAPPAAWAVPAAAIAIVAVQLINAPPAAGDGHPASGAWIALAASLLMGAGTALSLSDISITVQVRERDVRRRMPTVDRRAEATDTAADDVATGARGRRFRPRERPAAATAAASADDLQRTQPLPAVDEDEERTPERP